MNKLLRFFLTFCILTFSTQIYAQAYFEDQATTLGVGDMCGTIYLGGGISFYDFNNDGWDDITIATQSGDPLKIYKNNGDGTFSLETTLNPNNNAQQKQVIWVDFDNDGDNDLYISSDIHDGADAMATTIDPPGGGTVWCWDRDDAPANGSGDLQGMMITSSDASGCLTFVFTSDGSVTREGWQANITCNPLSVESAEVRGFLHYVDTVNNSFVVNAQSNIQSIEVYNLVGQMITTAKPNAASGEANLGSVKNGVFFARVTLENGRTSVVKFVK